MTTTIMVDELRVYPNAKHRCFMNGSCHLTVEPPEALDALHEFAASIGMKRSWFQNHPLAAHYDLTAGKRAAAIARGAVFVPAMDQARVRVARRRAK